jgi:hypothetical protein
MMNKIVKTLLVAMRYAVLILIGMNIGSMIETGFSNLAVINLIFAVIGFGLTFMTVTIGKVEEEVEDDE